MRLIRTEESGWNLHKLLLGFIHSFCLGVEVAERTASLVAGWQEVGFTHGVLNTDNMSILGLSIDYGPFGFLDAFDPSFSSSTTDLPERSIALRINLILTCGISRSLLQSYKQSNCLRKKKSKLCHGKIWNQIHG
ncbi:uncharacterized protein LOC141623751 isoform X1 [Silene latifolia]|uniref:uncharacterized protein LOC141623751 isoform X1 n=1 Tax=Silene latifolia TaxID=37657 RepID=UPI003D77C3D2